MLPAASPGIFAAIMIGFGRAVGETMIVLMATGNTPILDCSPFNGFRTLSANIAVEIPEAPQGATLYRVLFLSALLLFAVTFAANTAWPSWCASACAAATRGCDVATRAPLGDAHASWLARGRARDESAARRRARRPDRVARAGCLLAAAGSRSSRSPTARRVLGEIVDREVDVDGAGAARERLRIRVGNRDLGGADFRWIDERERDERSAAARTRSLLERVEWGRFYGFPVAVRRGERVRDRWRARGDRGAARAARRQADRAQ